MTLRKRQRTAAWRARFMGSRLGRCSTESRLAHRSGVCRWANLRSLRAPSPNPGTTSRPSAAPGCTGRSDRYVTSQSTATSWCGHRTGSDASRTAGTRRRRAPRWRCRTGPRSTERYTAEPGPLGLAGSALRPPPHGSAGGSRSGRGSGRGSGADADLSWRRASRTRPLSRGPGWRASWACHGSPISRIPGRSTRCGRTPAGSPPARAPADARGARERVGHRSWPRPRQRLACATRCPDCRARDRDPDRLRAADFARGSACRRPPVPDRPHRIAPHGLRSAAAPHAQAPAPARGHRRRGRRATRSHVFLVEAMARCSREDPSLEGSVELQLAGELTAADRAVAERHAFVRTPGLLSHGETVELLRSADLLFLPMHDLPAGERAGLIPYKTYEYLGARASDPRGRARRRRPRHAAPAAQSPWSTPGRRRGMTAALRRRLAAERAAPGAARPTLAAPAAYERRLIVAGSPRCSTRSRESAYSRQSHDEMLLERAR